MKAGWRRVKLCDICERNGWVAELGSLCAGPPRYIGGDFRRHVKKQSPSDLEVPRHIDKDKLWASLGQQKRLEQFRALIVQEIMIPMRLHQLGNQYGDLPARVGSLEFQNIVQNRGDN